MQKCKTLSTLFTIIALFLSSSPVFAQISLSPSFTDETFNNTTPNRPTEYIYQSYKAQELISIRLLGSVQKAGLYHVPKGMQLTTLLSLAGGIARDADLEKVTISNGQNNGLKPLRINLEQAFDRGESEVYQLQSNDLVYIKEKRPFISNDTWKAISIVSIFLTSAVTAIAIDDRL